MVRSFRSAELLRTSQLSVPFPHHPAISLDIGAWSLNILADTRDPYAAQWY